MTQDRRLALLMLGSLAFAASPPPPAHASGLYNHSYMAEKSMDFVEDKELFEKLDHRIDLFKFGSLNLDALAPVKGTIHTPEFLDAYAREITQQCFSNNWFCKHRSQRSCKLFNQGNCRVQGAPEHICSEDLDPSKPISEQEGIGCNWSWDCPNRETHAGLNLCRERGVCSDDYTTPCARGIGGGPKCSFPNTCETSYGPCIRRTDATCDKLITHFMGSVAHLVTDINADKFFLRSVHERADCVSGPPQSEEILAESPQFFTDQDMDAYLGFAGEYRGAPKALSDLLPSPRPAARGPIQDKILDEIIEKLDLRDADGEGDYGSVFYKRISFLLDIQWASMKRKVNEDGAADHWECKFQPAKNDCRDFPDRANCKECLPIFAQDLCNVPETKVPETKDTDNRVCEDDDETPCSSAADCANGSKCVPTVIFDGVCDSDDTTPCLSADGNCDDGSTCRTVEFDGVCTSDYTTQCLNADGCPGLGNSCSQSYGLCEVLPVRRPLNIDGCQWAIQDDQWHDAGGGVLDTAMEIAKLMDDAWMYMREGELLDFRMVGGFADRHLCVGRAGDPDCLTQKSALVTGGASSEGKGPLAGNLSRWSPPRFVEEVAVDKGSGVLRFALSGGSPRLAWEKEDGTPSVDCGNPLLLELDLSDPPPKRRERITNAVFSAFIDGSRLEVRTDVDDCSDGGRFLVKDVERIPEPESDPSSDVVANAGPDQLLECHEPLGALAFLDGSASTSPDGDLDSFAWSARGVGFEDAASPSPSATFPTGVNTATLVVSDRGNSDSDRVDVVVRDSIAPALTCPGDVVIECSEAGGADATDPAIQAFLRQVSATDACDDRLVLEDDVPLFFALGDTPLTFTATDAAGNFSECMATVTVQDTTPPSLSASLEPTLLWPPNHKLHDIAADVQVSDVCDPAPGFVLTQVTSSEPDNGTGDGDSSGDIASTEPGTPDTGFQLRAERAGDGPGRTYTAAYTATDASGNVSTTSKEVQVPHASSE